MWLHKGGIYSHLNEYENAVFCFEKALAINPRADKAKVFRAMMLVHLKKYEEAIVSCNQALSDDPNDEAAL